MTVYIVQDVKRSYKDKSGAVREAASMFNFDPAKIYGTLEFLLPAGDVSSAPAQLLFLLRHGLKDFNDTDHLIMTGDPIAMGVALKICAENNRGIINVLKWIRKEQRYVSLRYDIT